MTERLAIAGGPPVRSRPWPAWPEFGDAERAALERVLVSQNWGGFPAPNTEARAFAERFARYVETSHAVTCANGTVAIGLALQAARVEPGAEVVTTAYTFVGTATGILQAGCTPVFADVLADSYCIDPDQVEAAITPRTQAVVAVHLACSMADMDRLRALCDRRGLLLIEDCAHAHGARWRDRPAGSIGDLGTFSMQSSKLLTAGEGGAITTNDAAFAARAASLVNCGRKEAGADAFPERLLGTNARITEWQAAVLQQQLVRLPAQHERRAARAADFERAIAKLPGLRPLAHDARVTQRTFYQFIVRYEDGAWEGLSRDVVLRALQAEGVPAAGRFYVPLPEDPLFPMDAHTNPLARTETSWRREFPVAARAAYREAIWLPHWLFLGGADDVVDLVGAFAKVHAQAKELAARAHGGELA
jgi:dTDP-4-amino-4,6-dideoxygalactose transaminase